ncbi:transposase [Alicyclobacillus tolerans]|uniref:Transposase-like protein n=1 Tax=Alicyclobacillus tolerans TaxID=90970 RepID=A0ABT9LZK0_9BACL|nr:transposase-like protein [Alicyclobacillus tengchongensis]
MNIHHIRETHFRSGVVCPRCGSKSTKRDGKMVGTGRQRYFCKACGRTFSDLTGTPLSYTKKSAEMWDEMARCMREGKSLRATAEELNIAVSTAFAWRHKILASLREHTDEDSNWMASSRPTRHSFAVRTKAVTSRTN